MVVWDVFHFKDHCAAIIEIQPLFKFRSIFFNSSYTYHFYDRLFSYLSSMYFIISFNLAKNCPILF